MESLSEKVVLITGGAGALGLCMTKELLNNGVKGVAIVDVSKEAGVRVVQEMSSIFGNDKAIFIRTNITVKEELQEAFETTIRNFKQLDIVINNAGIINEIDWRQTVAVNFVAVVEGTYLAMQKYLPRYRSGEEGVIINTASVLGLQPLLTAPIYCSTKQALISLGRTLGTQEFYNEHKTRVLTICPGVVDTPLVDDPELSKKTFFPHRSQELIQAINPIRQKPEKIGKALIEVLERGENGSLWVIEDDKPLYEVKIPDYKTWKV